MTNATLRGKPDAGNPHVRFDEGEVASEKPRRGSLLYKRIMILTAMTVCAMAVCAADAGNSATNAVAKAARREKMLRASGGIIQQEAKGKVLVVNGQDKIPQGVIDGRVTDLRKVLRVTFETRKQEVKTDGGIAAIKLPAEANVALFIVNDAALPMSLVAVESGWGVINVATLTEGRRFTAEFNRVATLTLGAGASQIKGSYMQSVRSVADLDRIHDTKFKFDAVIAMGNNLRAVGVTSPRKVSYKVACQEGWAPQPTNEYQKAIWDKTHAIPTNPMKIEFDPKKGR